MFAAATTLCRRPLFVPPTGSAYDGPAALPVAEVSTTFPTVTGTTYNCPDLATYNTNIALAVGGDEIVLTGSFTGPINLPNRGDSGWVLIRSDNAAWASNSETRVSAATNMRTVTGAGTPIRALTTSTGAHHYYLCGIEFVFPTAGNLATVLCQVGSGETSSANLPHHIIFDRCYIHGDATNGGTRGIALDGNNLAVINSYIFDFKTTSSDTQALQCTNSQGPGLIENNYLSATGENIMFGGSDPTVSGAIPSDWTIRKNHLFKPLGWQATQVLKIKNLFELKVGRRILFERNSLQNCWSDGQRGHAFNIKCVNQNGGATANATEDVVIRDNKIYNVEVGMSTAGDASEGQPATLGTNRVRVRNNLFRLNNLTAANRYYLLHGGGGATYLSFVKNTFVSPDGEGWGITITGTGDNYTWQDNIFDDMTFGLKGSSGEAEGTASVTPWITTYVCSYNAFDGRTGTNYPANNIYPATSAALSMTNYASGDFTLNGGPCVGTASDGLNMGADVATIETYAAAAEAGT